ncbi:hypothetical protein FSP39_021184 [Pinctada imbricata]|uniref:TIR domain-containing protein n=1 Tax=Pinctada imbricata TaxID=66713 RepID=A0AA89C2B4_PINIB|nr:hypothetical protein FSP39_021184 [Pinctada imbricata]
MFAVAKPKTKDDLPGDSTHEKDENTSILKTKLDTIEDFQKSGRKFCEKLLSNIRASQNAVSDKSVYEDVRSVSKFLDLIIFSPLKLGQKFKVGGELMMMLTKDEDFGSFIGQAVKQMSKKNSSKEEDQILWSLFMNGAMGWSDFGKLLCNTDGFINVSKTILDHLFKGFDKKKQSPDQASLVNQIIAVLHNICTFGEGSIYCATQIRKAGVMPTYRKYLNCARLADDVFLRIPFIAAAADIMEEGDDILHGSRAEIEFMIVGVLEACNCWSGQFNGWYGFELGRVIGQLAVFDSNKRLLVEYGVLKALNVLAKQKEEVEQLTATKGLAHLAFNEENRKQMVEEENLGVVQTLIDLCKSSDFVSVRESAKGVLWTMSDLLHSSKSYAEQAEVLFERKLNGHVMISYSREQRPLLLKIKEELTKAGFKVWMDIEQMHDNVYDRMAEAIENAAVVLIAMSYSYKCSEYCRREAAYASSLKRARIPLLVETNYRPDSWLALMTAGDYHYDFVNKPFDSKITELIKTLKNRIVQENTTQLIPSTPLSHGSPDTTIIPSNVTLLETTANVSKEPEVITTMSSRENEYKKFQSLGTEDVLKWIDQNKLPRDFFGEWRAKDFVFMSRMKQQAPEYFYRYVLRLTKKIKSADTRTGLQISADLTDALDHLYLS